MPATPLIYDSDNSRDSQLAMHIAYAEEPFRVGIERAHELGETATAASLTELQTAASQKAKECFATFQTQESPPEQTATPAEQQVFDSSEITNKDRETIQHWLTDGLVTLHTWLGRNNIDQRFNPNYQNRFLTVYSDYMRALSSGVREWVDRSTPLALQKEFTDQGIPELITITKIQDKAFGSINKHSSGSDEGTVMLTYETLSGHSYSQYPGRGERVGNIVYMHIFFSDSEAINALKMITAKPKLIREVAEMFMSGMLQAGDSWDKARPAYEEWKDINDGVNRMAIREGFITKPEASKIIEF